MLEPSSDVPVAGSLVWLAVLVGTAFVISWAGATRLRLGRTSYVGVLTLVTAVLTAGYLLWLGEPVGDLLGHRAGWGLLGAPVAAAFLVVGMTRLPVVRRLRGRALARVLLWEALVYGVAEGVLLSALPVLVTWELVASLGWSGVAGGVAEWGLPLLASAVVIVVHHLGYWEYRNRLLVPITTGCGLLSLGYLATGSPLTPALGHVLGHTSSRLHGAELPPHPHTEQGLTAALPPAARHPRG